MTVIFNGSTKYQVRHMKDTCSTMKGRSTSCFMYNVVGTYRRLDKYMYFKVDSISITSISISISIIIIIIIIQTLLAR